MERGGEFVLLNTVEAHLQRTAGGRGATPSDGGRPMDAMKLAGGTNQEIPAAEREKKKERKEVLSEKANLFSVYQHTTVFPL